MAIVNGNFLILFGALLAVVAFLYSSVGHGGASGYLALMAIFAFPVSVVSILCGGKSSRMQSGKGLVLFRNKPFIALIVKAVLPISNTIQLVANTSQYDCLEYRKIKDIVADKGPLDGIYTALTHSETEINLILSCDIPLISTGILAELIAKHGTNFDVSVFKDQDRMHPLRGINSRTTLPAMKKAIEQNDLKMMRFISSVKHQLIPIAPDKRPLFKNINTVAELNQLNTNLS